MTRLLTCLLLVLLPAHFGLASPAAEWLPAPMPAASLDNNQRVQRVALGSCFNPARSDEIFAVINNTQADVLLLLGDNVYAEKETADIELPSLKAAYAALAASPAFADLRRDMPLLVTWDDHDYGVNDGGGDWPAKNASQALFKHVWAIGPDDPRTSRQGVYFSRIVGPVGQRLQIIMLDTRFFRTPLQKSAARLPGGRYIPSADPQQNMLGEAQWQWLEAQLRQPAEVRIIATSIQMIADGHNWEAWLTMPLERRRFYQLLQDTAAQGVVLVSGDRHLGALYEQTSDVPYPLLELTASSLNLPLSALVKNPTAEPGPFRLGAPYFDANFGLVDIDWDKRMLTLRLMNDLGAEVRSKSVQFDALVPAGQD